MDVGDELEKMLGVQRRADISLPKLFNGAEAVFAVQ
jgi:hypothetical protein